MIVAIYLSRHAATDEGKCEVMSRKYGWALVGVEKTPDDPVLKVDCVFEGKTEFPKPYHENEKESD
ncbi:MAG: hypothetical protein HC851_11255 [Acaryochloris sp. RU_4_1]|nr:hypothetical protein [Acaryochloris sp. RU_4_1]NJR56097.1 hypothetical protein [Acaryochloris sp. CRU_2_0]